MEKKQLIISLIRDSLINTRLIHGLEKLGLDSGNYYVHLGGTVFDLMGIKGDRDDLFEEYMEMCEQATQIDIFKYHELLNSSAQGIYERLKAHAE